MLEEGRRLKEALDKSVAEDSDEKVLDVLTAISKLPVTEAILKSTKLAYTVNKLVKAAVAAPPASSSASTKAYLELAEKIVAKWRADFRPETVAKTVPAGAAAAGNDTHSITSGSSSISAKSGAQTDLTVRATSGESASSATTKLSTASSSGQKSLQSTTVLPIPAENLALMTEYVDQRKKVINNIYDVLMQSATNCDPFYVCTMAMDIETAMYNAYPPSAGGMSASSTLSKSYIDKYRMLMPNLRRNEELRDDILDGRIPGPVLITLSVDQLATKSQQEAALKVVKNKMESTRSDFYDLNRDKIMQANGLDPNQGGEFTCRCGSNKTSSHAMQTRSSDEPMTIFVRCLKCSRRWRC